MEREHIFIKNLNSLYKNPIQTIQVANYIFENSENDIEKAEALFLLSKSKMLQGNTVEGLEDLLKAKEILKENDAPFISALTLIALSKRCRLSGIDNLATTYLKQAAGFSKEIKSEPEVAIVKTELLLEQAIAAKNDKIESLQKLKQAERIAPGSLPALQAKTANKIGQYYLQFTKSDSATLYFNKAISILKDAKLENSSLHSVSLSGLGNFYFLQNELDASKAYYIGALELPIIENSVRVAILEKLSEIYKRMDSLALSQKYYNEKATLNAQIIDDERKVRSILFSHLEEEQQNSLLRDKEGYYKWGALLAGLFLLTFIGYYFYNRKLNREYKRFQKVIAQVEKDEKLQAPFSIDDTTVKSNKGVIIPEETEKLILERLEEFEKSTKFTNSNMNLSLLAKQMKTNSKYISEIIHTHKQKNFNTYINELRVNYIINKMKTDKAYLNYKVSYLAESCGFSSHSAFTVVFKSITEFTPKQFISFLKKSRKEKSATF